MEEKEKSLELEERFNENLEVWRKHVRANCYSSKIADYIDCEAFDNIVKMGEGVLPILRKAFYSEEEKGRVDKLSPYFVQVVGRIDSGFHVPDWMRGKIPTIEKYTARYLDDKLGVEDRAD